MLPAQSFVLLFSNLSIDASNTAVKSSSKVDCARICFQRQHCSSFSYNAVSKSCIVSERVLERRELVKEPGFQYYSVLKNKVILSPIGAKQEAQKHLFKQLNESGNDQNSIQTQKTRRKQGKINRRKSRKDKNTKGKCPRGWSYKKGDADRCYKLVKKAKKWSDAKTSCEEKGGFIAIADSMARAELMKDYVQHLEIRSLITKTEAIYFWLGGFYDGNEWMWVDNRTIQYEGWKKGEPTHNKSSCLRQFWLGWDDCPCLTDHLYYLCQIQM